MSNLTTTHNFVIENPDGWIWNISCGDDGCITITVTDEPGSTDQNPTVLTMTKEEAFTIVNAIKTLIT